MNIYRHVFAAPCPNNDRQVDYTLEIRTPRVIMVEAIMEACAKATECPKPYHETMADLLFEQFAGQQRLVAFHHGVEIETHRGTLPA